jgi:hypothetical protein
MLAARLPGNSNYDNLRAGWTGGCRLILAKDQGLNQRGFYGAASVAAGFPPIECPFKVLRVTSRIARFRATFALPDLRPVSSSIC